MSFFSESRAWAHSLRFRLTLWYTGVLAVILTGSSLLILIGARQALMAETDGFLASEAHRLMQDTAERPGAAPDPEDLRESVATSDAMPASTPGRPRSHLLLFDVVYLRLVPASDGPAWAASPRLMRQPALTASLDALRPTSPSFAFAGPDDERMMRVLTTPVRLGLNAARLQVAVPWDHNADLLEQLGLLLLVGVPAVLLLAAAGGWVLVGRTLQPINRIVAEAERLDAADLPEALLPAAAETDGEIGRLVATLNRMTMRLRDAFDTQRRFAEAQQRFAADASHELRTPLTILRGEMELALSRPRSVPTYQATLTSAVEEVARMSRIVEGLFFLARQDAGQGGNDPHFEDVDLGVLCRMVAAELAPQAHKKELALRVVPPPTGSPSPMVKGNADQLQQLLRNLVDNAIKYTSAGGTVTISAAENAAGEIALTVRDTGIGITPDDMPHVFDRFWRADRSRTGDGNGLGLAICTEIAHAHGSRIDAASQPGAGSCFTLRLPAG